MNKHEEKLELFFNLMVKQEIGLVDFAEYIFKNKIKNVEYIPAFIDEFKKRLGGE